MFFRRKPPECELIQALIDWKAHRDVCPGRYGLLFVAQHSNDGQREFVTAHVVHVGGGDLKSGPVPVTNDYSDAIAVAFESLLHGYS